MIADEEEKESDSAGIGPAPDMEAGTQAKDVSQASSDLLDIEGTPSKDLVGRDLSAEAKEDAAVVTVTRAAV